MKDTKNRAVPFYFYLFHRFLIKLFGDLSTLFHDGSISYLIPIRNPLLPSFSSSSSKQLNKQTNKPKKKKKEEEYRFNGVKNQQINTIE